MSKIVEEEDDDHNDDGDDKDDNDNDGDVYKLPKNDDEEEDYDDDDVEEKIIPLDKLVEDSPPHQNSVLHYGKFQSKLLLMRVHLPKTLKLNHHHPFLQKRLKYPVTRTEFENLVAMVTTLDSKSEAILATVNKLTS